MTIKQNTVLGNGCTSELSGWRLTYVGVFSVVFVVAVIAQLLGLDWQSWFSVSEGKSFLSRIKGATFTAMAHVY